MLNAMKKQVKEFLCAAPNPKHVSHAPTPITEEGTAVARKAKDLFFEMEARSYDGGPDKTCSRY